MNRLQNLALAVSCVFAFAPIAHAKLSDADRTALSATHAAASDLAHDPAKTDWEKYVAAHYSADAKLMPQNGAVIDGRAAIVAFFKSLPPITKFKTVDVELDGDGDTAYIRGSYELTMAPPESPPIVDKGKYLEIWRRQADGTWICTLDIFNSDAPPSEAPAEAVDAAMTMSEPT